MCWSEPAPEPDQAAGVTITDLITPIVGIVLATEHHPDPAAAADRLFRPAVAGLDGP